MSTNIPSTQNLIKTSAQSTENSDEIKLNIDKLFPKDSFRHVDLQINNATTELEEQIEGKREPLCKFIGRDSESNSLILTLKFPNRVAFNVSIPEVPLTSSTMTDAIIRLTQMTDDLDTTKVELFGAYRITEGRLSISLLQQPSDISRAEMIKLFKPEPSLHKAA